jgi:hypothetical protein
MCLCVYEAEKNSEYYFYVRAVVYFEWQDRSMIKDESFLETYPKRK